jgi:hypothetical protein
MPRAASRPADSASRFFSTQSSATTVSASVVSNTPSGPARSAASCIANRRAFPALASAVENAWQTICKANGSVADKFRAIVSVRSLQLFSSNTTASGLLVCRTSA